MLNKYYIITFQKSYEGNFYLCIIDKLFFMMRCQIEMAEMIAPANRRAEK